jgi:hypothetical protein
MEVEDRYVIRFLMLEAAGRGGWCCVLHRLETFDRVIGVFEPMSSLLPHELTNDVTENRLTFGRQLLEILEQPQSADFRLLVTGAESWIPLSYASRAIWTMLREEVPTREKQAICRRKVILTGFWSVDGFHVVEFFLAPTKFDTPYFAEHISPSLATML